MISLKNVLKRILRGKYHGLNSLDKKLEWFVDFENGYLVELGANDGVTQSNSLYFEKYRGWCGLLVEPTPHNYLKCIQNRSKKSNIFCAAFVSFSFTSDFVRIAYSNLMSAPIGLQSDISNPHAHAQNGRAFLGKRESLFEFGAVARTLNSLLLEANAPTLIDFLSLDVESAELEVLQGVDHHTYRFKYVLVECRDLPRLSAYLEVHGYRFIEKLSEHDCLFTSLARA